MTRRILVLIAAALSVAAMSTSMPGFSSASFTARTTNTGSITAAPDWTPPTVSVSNPGSPLKGTVTLTATATDAKSGISSVRLQYLPANGSSWVTVCTATVAPYTCAWNTTTVTDGAYEVRAVATDNAGYSATSATVSTTVANNLLVVLGDPGDIVRGTVALPVNLYGAGTTTYTVRVEYAPTGTTTWKSICTNMTSPYSCSWNTTLAAYPNGEYDLRAVATAGSSTTYSTVIAAVLVDNTAPTVTMTDPGSPLAGTVTLAATATDAHSGVTQVVLQAQLGTGTWRDLCTITAQPYTCDWNTTTVTDGLYDFRAILVDGTGKVTTSTTVTARRVDNSPLRGLDIQTANGGATPGKIENGDTVTFTYSDQVNLATVTSGWNGSALAVTLRVRDGGLLGLGNKGDTLDIQRVGGTVNLGSVNLKEDYVKTGKTVVFNATMTATTATVNGAPVTVVTIQLGTLASGGGIRTVSTLQTMAWSPTSLVTDLYGNTCSTAPVNETGTLDREF